MITLKATRVIVNFAIETDSENVLQLVAVLAVLLGWLVLFLQFSWDVLAVPFEIASDFRTWVSWLPLGHRFIGGLG